MLSPLYRMNRVELTDHFAYFLRVHYRYELAQQCMQRRLLRSIPQGQTLLHFLHTRVGPRLSYGAD